MTDTPIETATILQYPGNFPGRTQRLSEEQLSVLRAFFLPFQEGSEGIPMSQVVRSSTLSGEVAAKALSELESMSLVAARANPIGHYRMTMKGSKACETGYAVFEPESTILGRAGVPKIGDRR